MCSGATVISAIALVSGEPPSSPWSTPISTSRAFGAAASTSTLGSKRRASSIAASRSSALSTRLIPKLDPARAGLTKTG